MVAKFSDKVRATWKGDAVVQAPTNFTKKPAETAKAAEEDEFDPFAEDADADAAAAESMKKKQAEA